MEIKRYFKKEIYKNYLLCSIPFMLIIFLSILYVIGANEEAQIEQVWMLFLLIDGLLALTGIIIISMYARSYKKYEKKLSLFSPEELERINREAKRAFNMGKILITNDAIIYFSFFKKEIIRTKIIKDVEKVEGTYTAEGRDLKTEVDYHTIIIKCMNNKNVFFPAPKNYNGNECENCVKIIKHIIKNMQLNQCQNRDEYIDINSLKEANTFINYKEFRISSIMQVVVAITYLLVCFIINSIIKNGSDSVLKAFYSIAFRELIFLIELVIYTIIFVTISIYYKLNNKNVVKGKKATDVLKPVIFLLLILFIRISIDTANHDYEKEIRSDYIYYVKNECKTYKGEILHDSDENYHGILCTSYEVNEDGEIIRLLANKEMLGLSTQSIDESKTYKIIYLPKTHFIVDIKEVY